MGGEDGPEGMFPDPEAPESVATVAIQAIQAGIDPEEVGITPDDLGLEAESFNDVSEEKIKQQVNN